ncbi:MAG: hypothetical protein ACOCY0_00685 [Roseicyclus sp.]
MRSRARAEAQDDRAGRRALALVLIGALLYVTLRFAAIAGDPVGALVASPFNDSLMRYLSVTDWLAGQDWFDMGNARVLPPEGLSLHWSRYVDLGIGGVIAGLGLALPPERAAPLALVVWPALLFVAFLALTARQTLRLFGPRAAAFAVLSLVLWQLTWNYFGPAQLDHHGPQILLLAVVIFSLLGPEETRTRRGLLGGAAAALSVAIGLENLAPIAAAGLVLALRVTLRPEDAPQLRAFAGALAALAALLHFGQTPRAEWLMARCDELGPAFLGLVGLAAAAALILAAAAPRLPRLRPRIVLTAATGLAAAAGALLILRTCPGFPYGNLPPELQEIIARGIAEARPAQAFVLALSDPAFTLLPPAFGTTLIASALFAWRWRAGRDTGPERQAVAILLLFAWIGCAGALAQIRLLLLAAPVVPVLLGYVLAHLLAARAAMAHPSAGSLAMLAVALTCLAPGQVYMAFRVGATMVAEAAPAPRPDGPRPLAACRDSGILESLRTLPQGRVLSDLQLSTAILITTPHAVVSAPYHRSAEALANGTLALRGDAERLLTALETSSVDYLVLCRGATYAGPDTFVTALARGEAHPALTGIAGLHPDLVVLRPAP